MSRFRDGMGTGLVVDGMGTGLVVVNVLILGVLWPTGMITHFPSGNLALLMVGVVLMLTKESR